jgi:DNA-binding response OmpR family regulator
MEPLAIRQGSTWQPFRKLADEEDEKSVPPIPSTTPTRILVVDDDVNHLRLLTAGLRLERFVVDSAPDAEIAQHLLRHANYDIALLDVMMPGTSGLELARRMAAAHPAVRVVLMSAYHLSERQLRQADCGAVGFIPKPYRLEELAKYLRDKVPQLERAIAQAG